MNDLYLIGNGFDLAHGLKTSYNDFLLWYLMESIKQYNKRNVFDDNLIKIRHNGYQSNLSENITSIEVLLKWCDERQYFVTPHHNFFRNLIKNYHEYRWVDIEYEYYMALVEIYRDLGKADLLRSDFHFGRVKPLNDCFDAIKKKLIEYLTVLDGADKEKINSINNVLLEGTEETQKLILYFNYTSTIKAYVSNYLFKSDDLIFIHGKLDEPYNSIIFGYGDEMDPHYDKIENLNNNEFLKNIKSFGYFKTTNYQNTIRFVESGDFTVKILGHSCGISDRILLNTIFEHPNCKAIKIYYYQKSETENDYFEKTQEISRHFKAQGKGNMRAKIVPFDESVPLVPYDERKLIR